MNGPLDGLVVFDLTRILAGPSCTQILGDLGAEVIKIERPGAGDDTRNFAPPYLPRADGEDSSESAYFAGTNRNKRSVTLNLGHPEGQAIARRLIAGERHPRRELQDRNPREVRLGVRRPQGRAPRAHLLLGDRVRAYRALRGEGPRLRCAHPGDGRGHEHHRGAGRGADEGGGVDRRPHVGNVRGGRDPRRGAPSALDRGRPARRHLHARRPRRVAREPGHELPRDRREPAPARQPAPEHRPLPGDAGRGRLLRAVGRERPRLRTVLRGGGLPAPARGRAVRDGGRAGAQSRRRDQHPERHHPDPAPSRGGSRGWRRRGSATARSIPWRRCSRTRR